MYDRFTAPKRADTWFVYGLVDHREPHRIRYIGVTNHPRARMGMHVSQHSREGWRKSRWIGSVLAAGGRIAMRIFAQGLSQQDAMATEVSLIAEYRAVGDDLTNLTDGGDGVVGQVQSSETREKKRLALSGVPKSAAARKRMSEARMGRLLSSEHRAALSAAHLARYAANPSANDVQRAGTLRRYQDITQREATGRQTAARFDDPAAREAHSALMRFTFAQDPSIRARAIATQRHNGPQSNNKTGFKGVFFDVRRGDFCARIKVFGKQRHLGYFDTAEDAARAYDRAALLAWDHDCYLNFPEIGHRLAVGE